MATVGVTRVENVRGCHRGRDFKEIRVPTIRAAHVGHSYVCLIVGRKGCKVVATGSTGPVVPSANHPGANPPVIGSYLHVGAGRGLGCLLVSLENVGDLCDVCLCTGVVLFGEAEWSSYLYGCYYC